jgi:hypothetical protein
MLGSLGTAAAGRCRRAVSPRLRGVLLASGFGIAVLAAWLVVARSSRPAWFTVGGELIGSQHDQPPFGPLVWKRRCIGGVWHEWSQGAQWWACAGWPTGPRLLVRSFDDAEAWAVPGVPAEVDATAIAEATLPVPPERAAILSWRRRVTADEALLVAQGASGSWTLARVCLPGTPDHPLPADSPDRGPRTLDTLVLDHRPTPAELTRFVTNSGWTVTALLPSIERWGIDSRAWEWPSSPPAELDREIARLKSYVSPSYATTMAEALAVEAAWAAVDYELVPNRSVVLPERLATEAARPCSRAGVEFDATWAPTPRDIRELERRLPELNGLLHRSAPRTDVCRVLRGPTVNDFHRQYSGMVVDGRRVIYLNALLNSLVGSDWRTRVLGICDGGPVAWGALYDPALGVFYELRTNGYA